MREGVQNILVHGIAKLKHYGKLLILIMKESNVIGQKYFQKQLIFLKIWILLPVMFNSLKMLFVIILQKQMIKKLKKIVVNLKIYVQHVINIAKIRHV
ncbi:hypothetical protein PVBG_04513 [Plasmodium vivax Brazil I]|uniref:Uncharacterized protein n=1 Tax=Plasmodium vivax (strain Brazil I) TaxID=1033975 RepID=A0A0J9SUX7_PLAV1|nr:hypothetical protein PVBG_04513 [Plasmodium vivax Brazil I]